MSDLEKLLASGTIPEEERPSLTKTFAEWRTFFHNSRPHFHGGKIQDIAHMSFSAIPILGWLLGSEELPGALKAHRIAVREIKNLIDSVSKTGR